MSGTGPVLFHAQFGVHVVEIQFFPAFLIELQDHVPEILPVDLLLDPFAPIFSVSLKNGLKVPCGIEMRQDLIFNPDAIMAFLLLTFRDNKKVLETVAIRLEPFLYLQILVMPFSFHSSPPSLIGMMFHKDYRQHGYFSKAQDIRLG
jgi:hypothetical protein